MRSISLSLAGPSALFAFLFLLATSVFAQSDPLAGRVTDQHGRAIVGAELSFVRNMQTDRSPDRAVTGPDGTFALSLPPGSYTLTVRADGFASLSHRVDLSAGSALSLDLELHVASAEATVTVADTSEYRSGSITSASKIPANVRDLPQSITLVGRPQIDDQLPSGIGDLTRYQPGVTGAQGENNRDQIIIRGQDSSADFFVNGIRDDVQHFRDLYNVERVEFLRGPNAMIFGRGGGGGVVNRIKKEAPRSPFYSTSFQGGSLGNRRVAVDVGRPIVESVAFRVNGFAEAGDSFRRGVGYRRFGMEPTITIEPDDSTRVTLSYEVFRDRRTADRGIPSLGSRPAPVDAATFYGDADSSSVRANVNALTAGVERNFGRLVVRSRFSHGDYLRFYQNYVPGSIDAAGDVAISAYNNRTQRHNSFSQTDVIYDLRSGGMRHTILGGFELGLQRTANYRQTGYFGPGTGAANIRVPFRDPHVPTAMFRQGPSDANNLTRASIFAAYVQDQVDVGRHVKLIGGVRFDSFRLGLHNNRTLADLARTDRFISPRFGVVIKPVERLSIYTNYSVSFLPSSGDQFASLTNETLGLEPEKFLNLEAGLKWDVTSRLALTAALYRLDRTNTKAADPDRPGVIVQTGAQRTNGFELFLSGDPMRRWSITGGYAWQDAFISASTTAAPAGRKVGQVPRHSFSLWNKFQAGSRLSAGLGLVARSDMFASLSNTVVLPGYIRVDGAVYYTFNEHWRIQANIENLMDARYFANAHNNTNISPGTPRAFKIAVLAKMW